VFFVFVCIFFLFVYKKFKNPKRFSVLELLGGEKATSENTKTIKN